MKTLFILLILFPFWVVGQLTDADLELAIVEIEKADQYDKKKSLIEESLNQIKFKNKAYTLKLSDIAIDASRLAKDTTYLLKALHTKAIQFINFHRFEEASTVLEEIEDLSIKTLDTLNLTLYYIHEGFLKKRRNQFTEAIFYYEKGRVLAKQNNDERRYANATNRLGLLMVAIGEREKACAYYRQVVALEGSYFKSTAILNLMETYANLGKIDSTKKYLTLAESMDKLSSPAMVEIYRTKSKLALYNKEPDLAVEYMEKAVDHSFVHDYVMEQIYSTIALYQLKKEYKNERDIQLLTKAKQVAESVSDLHALKIILNEFAMYYNNQNLAKKSIQTYKQYVDVNNQHIEILKNDISEMDKNIYTLFQKETENVQLFMDNQNKKVALGKRQRQRNFWLVLSTLFAIATFITFRLLKQKQILLQELREKQRLIEQAVEEKQVLLQEMNHRIKNNYNIIGDMLKHANEKEDIEYIRSKLNGMAVIHTIILEYSNAQTSINSLEFFPKFLRHLKKSYFSGGEVSIKTDIDSHEIFTNHAVLMGIVINEIFTNIWKHEDLTQPLEIAFHYHHDRNDHVSMSWISKNTKQSAVPSNGKGQRILKDLLIQNGGSLDVQYGSECNVLLSI